MASGRIFYVCPEDPEEVLYIEDPNILKMIVFSDAPTKCSKCKKSYYKHECDMRPE
jgi:hypothetical protein